MSASSTAGNFSVGWRSTGIPRPSSVTSTPSSSRSRTVMRMAWPARCSSTALSTTSQMRWCRPRGSVEPMYIAGRLRTPSRPLRTLMDFALYSVTFGLGEGGGEGMVMVGWRRSERHATRAGPGGRERYVTAVTRSRRRCPGQLRRCRRGLLQPLLVAQRDGLPRGVVLLTARCTCHCDTCPRSVRFRSERDRIRERYGVRCRSCRFIQPLAGATLGDIV